MAENSGIDSNILSLPSGGASENGLGEQFQTDLYTGTAVFGIPIELPAAGGGFKPELTLSYSSGAGNSAFGHGWDLWNLAITVSTRRGIPNSIYNSKETFILAGQEELVETGNDRYRPGTDRKNWLILREGEFWIVTTKDGTRYFLGNSDNSRLVDPVNNRTFSWYLSKIESPRGHTADYLYFRDNNCLYLKTISYGPFKVVLEYEERPDIRYNSRFGFSLKQRLRCREIRIESERSASGVLRRYYPEYDNAGHNELSLLKKVRLVAGQGLTRVDFPELCFRYTDNDFENVLSKTFDINPNVFPPSLASPEVNLVDLFGEGLPGIVEGKSTGWTYWRNLGGLQWEDPQPLPNIPVGMSLAGSEIQFADLEGNGTADLLLDLPGTQGYFPNKCDGRWAPLTAYENRIPFNLTDPEFRLYDIDGDGRVDGIYSGTTEFLIYRNLGSRGWLDEVQRVPRIFDLEQFPDIHFSDPGIFTGDMTGDQLTDIVLVQSGDVSYWAYSGHGQWGRRTRMDQSPVLPHDFDRSRLKLADINGDGLADLIYVDADHVKIWFNCHGIKFTPEFRFELNILSSNSVSVADMTGSGQSGLLIASPDPNDRSAPYRYVTFGEQIPNLLTSIKNGLGHTTNIRYESATKFQIADRTSGNSWKSFLPFSLQVVSEVENIDEPARVRTVTKYNYSNGHYDGAEREFNGFGSVRELIPGDETVPTLIRVHTFHAGTDLQLSESERREMAAIDRKRLRSLRGSPLSTESFEAAGGGPALRIEKSGYIWQSRLEYEGTDNRVFLPHLTLSQTDAYKEDIAVNRTIEQFEEPDSFGNLKTRRTEAGSLSNGVYRRECFLREETVFVRNEKEIPEDWLVGLQSEKILYNEHDEGIAATRWYYDGIDFEGLEHLKATSGNVTRVEELVFYPDETNLTEPEMLSLGFHFIDPSAGKISGWYRNKLRCGFDDRGNVIKLKDPLGNESAITYDSHRILPIRVIDSAGLVTSATIDFDVEATKSLTSIAGVTEYRVYDAAGRTSKIYKTADDGSLALRAHVFYDRGNFLEGGAAKIPASITSVFPAGRDAGKNLSDVALPDLADLSDIRIQKNFYSGCGLNLMTVATSETGVFNDGNRTIRSGNRSYNIRGKVTKEGRPQFAADFDYQEELSFEPVIQVSYDVQERVNKLKHPLGEREALISPRELQVIDENGMLDNKRVQNIQQFDGWGRLVKVIQQIDAGTWNTTRYRYNESGRLLEIIDSTGESLMRYTYDRLGRKTSCRHRDAGLYEFVYDAQGNLIKSKKPDGTLIINEYDSIQRLIVVSEVLSSGEQLKRRQFFYDQIPGNNAPGQLCKVIDEGGEVFLYYSIDRKLVSKVRQLPDGRKFKLDFTHDFEGKMTGITYPNGMTVEYVYNEANLIRQIPGYIDFVSYNENAFPTEIFFANGIKTFLRYDKTERVNSIRTVRTDGTVLSELEYSYDPVGNISRISDSVLGEEKEITSYDYDFLYRLKSVVRSPANEPLRFLWDEAGNLLTNEEHLISSAKYEDTARSGLLTGIEWRDGRPSAARSYDAAGRLIRSENFRRLDYDCFGYLKHIDAENDVSTEFVYDYRGHRLLKTVLNPDLSLQSYVTIDDLYEEGPAGGTCFIRGVLGLIASVQKAGVTFYHNDHLGSPKLETDQAGDILSIRRFTCFGLSRSAGKNLISYLGKAAEIENELQQFGERFFDPVTGRFLTPDFTILESPERFLANPQALNLYSYAVNNPVRYLDPDGRFAIIAAIIIGAIIGGFLGAKAASESGGNWVVGAIVGAIIGGLAGGFGLLGAALQGAAIGSVFAAVSGHNIWIGAAVGFGFGAFGGAVAQWVPVVGGEGFGVDAANFFIEVGSDAVVGGLSAGVTASLEGQSFWRGFEAGFVMGAALGAVKVIVLGVRFDPESVHSDFQENLETEFKTQNAGDHSYVSADTNKVPDLSGVTYRRGGLLWRSFVLNNSINLEKSAYSKFQSGNYNVLAHEVRHIAQQDAASGGFLEFAVARIYQAIFRSDEFYTKGNTTLEGEYLD